jgi:hypothetical protein
VIQNGQPLADANVVFYGEANWVIGGRTGTNGIAVLYTHGTFVGAPAGKFKITVAKTITEGGPTEADKNNPSYAGGGGRVYDTVDKKFRSAKATPLEIEIRSDKKVQTHTLNVEKSVKVLQPKA